jgi:23S rRNA (pseudouridine1915-N3)-methyltransferase
MSEIVLVAIGRAGRTPEAELVARYAERLRPKLRLVELPDGRGAPAECRRREGEALLAALPEHAFVVALDLGGKVLDTETFAARLGQWLETGRKLAFVIGGAEGFDRAVIDRADFVLSLGAMTWPHQLARAMLAEQIYRAQAIAAGHPYHRAGRP